MDCSPNDEIRNVDNLQYLDKHGNVMTTTVCSMTLVLTVFNNTCKAIQFLPVCTSARLPTWEIEKTAYAAAKDRLTDRVYLEIPGVQLLQSIVLPCFLPSHEERGDDSSRPKVARVVVDIPKKLVMPDLFRHDLKVDE